MFLTDTLATQVGTFALVPQVVDAVKVPVIAAGGIGDGRGIVAALALGAAGVGQLRTAAHDLTQRHRCEVALVGGEIAPRPLRFDDMSVGVDGRHGEKPR